MTEEKKLTEAEWEQKKTEVVESIATACRKLGCEVAVLREDTFAGKNQFTGFRIDGESVSSSIAVETVRRNFERSLKLVLQYTFNARLQRKQETKGGFDVERIADEICQEVRNRIDARNSHIAHENRRAVNLPIAWMINVECGVEGTTPAIDLGSRNRYFSGPQAGVDKIGNLVVQMGSYARDSESLPATPAEAREFITVAQRIYRAHKTGRS